MQTRISQLSERPCFFLLPLLSPNTPPPDTLPQGTDTLQTGRQTPPALGPSRSGNAGVLPRLLPLLGRTPRAPGHNGLGAGLTEVPIHSAVPAPPFRGVPEPSADGSILQRMKISLV